MAIRLFKPGGGSLAHDTIGDEISLYLPSPITTAQYQSFWTDSATGAYSVAAAKSLYIRSILILSAAAGGGFQEFGYGNAAVANSVSAPASATLLAVNMFVATANDTKGPFPVNWVIPTGKFPYVRANGANPAILLCGVVF